MDWPDYITVEPERMPGHHKLLIISYPLVTQRSIIPVA
jgi:hypothetical protein